MKFRKKPIVIEAEQFDPEKPWPKGVLMCYYHPDFGLGDSGGWETCSQEYARWHDGQKYHFIIRTLEGDMQVRPGDWIITGIKGEKYPCKPEIFELTYEKVPDCSLCNDTGIFLQEVMESSCSRNWIKTECSCRKD